MEEQLVTFETAKLAKEKRFNKPINWYYYPLAFMLNDKPRLIADGALDPNKTFYDGIITDNTIGLQLSDMNSLSEGYYSAPTQSLLQKWLRDVHEIYVSPKESHSFDNTLEFVCTVNNTYVNHNILNKPINRFDTYEEALEIGLIEGLKLIKL